LYHDRLYRMFVQIGQNIAFSCNGFIFGKKLITTKHGFHLTMKIKDQVVEEKRLYDNLMVQSSVSSTWMKDPFVEIPEGGGDLIYFPLRGVASPQTVKLAVPKNGEAVWLIAYDNEKDALPAISSGMINEEGYHTCPSIDGNCGGVVVNEQGEVVGFHQAGSKSINKCIPLTQALIQSLKQDF